MTEESEWEDGWADEHIRVDQIFIYELYELIPLKT